MEMEHVTTGLQASEDQWQLRVEALQVREDRAHTPHTQTDRDNRG
jgi:hypothetical protein